MSDPTHADRIRAAAQDYDGWPLIEIHGVGPDGTCHCHRAKNCGSAGKHPVAGNWQIPAPLDLDAMLAAHPRANIGTLTGRPAGFWVLDVDKPGLDAMDALIAEHGPLPETRIHQTGSGTRHYFFSMPEFDVTNSNRLPTGIDTRGTGGQVVLPPSRSSKGYYEVMTAAMMAPAPKWLLDFVRPEVVEERSELPKSVVSPAAADAYETGIINGELGRLRAMAKAATPDGKGYTGEAWDSTTFEVACKLFELANAGWSALTPDEVPVLVDADAPRDGGFTDSHVREKIASARRKVGSKARIDTRNGGSNTAWFDEIDSDGPTSAAPPATHPKRTLDDVGNAERLVDRVGDRIRWAADADGWLSYDGRHWSESAAMTHLKRYAIAALEQAREHERALHSEVVDEFYANGNDKSSPRDRFDGWMSKSRFDARIKAMLSVAQADARIECSMADFDTARHLLNVGNGVVDLRTGTRLEHDSSLMLKAFTDVEYDPLARCPTFDAFLERVQPDPAMRGYLQTVAGYSITGETQEQALFLHNGHGANGKTVFLEIIREILGSMGQKMARDTIMSKNGQASGIPDDVAAMLGGRFLQGSETAAGKKLDDERIKELVGGEAQHARHLYGKWFDFKPTGKIHIATNHLPVMESGGHGMGRRLRIIPWEVTIPEAEQDKTLQARILEHEAPGVLAWLVRGAIEWYARGLRTPEVVTERTQEHIEDADPLLPFIREKLVVDERAETRFKDITHAYGMWCDANRVRPMSSPALSAGLVERLGHGSRFLNQPHRQSCFRVRVNLEPVSDAHARFFQTGT